MPCTHRDRHSVWIKGAQLTPNSSYLVIAQKWAARYWRLTGLDYLPGQISWPKLERLRVPQLSGLWVRPTGSPVQGRALERLLLYVALHRRIRLFGRPRRKDYRPGSSNNRHLIFLTAVEAGSLSSRCWLISPAAFPLA